MASKKTVGAGKNAPKKPVTFKDIGAVLRAKKNGKLPRGLKLYINPDRTAAWIKGQVIEVARFEGKPAEILNAVFKAIGLKSEVV